MNILVKSIQCENTCQPSTSVLIEIHSKWISSTLKMGQHRQLANHITVASTVFLKTISQYVVNYKT